MRAGNFTFFAVVLVLTGVMIAGCSVLTPTTQEQNITQKKIDTGFSSVPVITLQESYSFDTMKQRLGDVVFDDDLDTVPGTLQGRHILYVRGMQMDSAGNAKRWIIAIRHGADISLVTYDRSGETISDWNSTVRVQEIAFDRILSPGSLLDRNHDLIFPNGTGTADIELQGGRYTLTIPGTERTRILIFNSTTGALIPSYE